MKKYILLLMMAVGLYRLPFFFLQQDKTQREMPAMNRCEYEINVIGQGVVPLEQYVQGVVSAEMPASFQLEALKAQAIAARTYALHQTNFGKNPIQPTTAHQVFSNKEARQQKWQEAFAQYEQKMVQAIEQTKGQVLMYNGDIITAMFHASSNGQTESAQNYSGTSYPYLQSVPSTEQDVQQKTLQLEQLQQLLGQPVTIQQVRNAKITRNTSGRVQSIQIGQTNYTGKEMRELLTLRSTDFSFEVKKNELLITTKGYGHGVGMSQYGANELAEQGKDAQTILQHYYKGATMQPLTCEKK